MLFFYGAFLIYMLKVCSSVNGLECRLSPITHIIEHEGCVPKPISSFACVGQCLSSVKVSSNGIWQMERSCMCCQEYGEIEATVILFCPNSDKMQNIFKKIETKAPQQCMCRSCIKYEEDSIFAHELLAYKDQDRLPNFQYKI